MSRTDSVVSENTPGPRLQKEKVGQDQSISGMVTVPVVSLILVVLGFATMLASSVKSPDKDPNVAAAAERLQQ